MCDTAERRETYFQVQSRSASDECMRSSLPRVPCASSSTGEKLPLRVSNIRQTIFCGQFGRIVDDAVVAMARTRRAKCGNDSWLAGKLQSPDALSSIPPSGETASATYLSSPRSFRERPRSRANLSLTTPTSFFARRHRTTCSVFLSHPSHSSLLKWRKTSGRSL